MPAPTRVLAALALAAGALLTIAAPASAQPTTATTPATSSGPQTSQDPLDEINIPIL
ncbi:hypothetical protein OHR68_39730 [Spirillospora sp. NBC_00431]